MALNRLSNEQPVSSVKKISDISYCRDARYVMLLIYERFGTDVSAL